jgi:hypothetical protein
MAGVVGTNSGANRVALMAGPRQDTLRNVRTAAAPDSHGDQDGEI